MIKVIVLAGSIAWMGTTIAQAQAPVEEDDIVRLPGQGEIRAPRLREQARAERLKPGAGLFITFDSNQDGRITSAEIDAGIPAAFANADKNQDGFVTAIEQQEWAADLPTRDDSLANPFRFDPNLDRRADLEEFTSVITNLALDYKDEESGDIIVADLKAPPPRETRQDAREDVVRRPADQARRRNQSVGN
ncbi:MAG: hypothetical protein AAGL90_00040 [Pseudomonadota bacterium]